MTAFRCFFAVAVLACSLHAAAQAHPDFVLPGAAQGFSQPLATRVAAVRAESVAAHVEMLASPAMEGRGLGSRGLDTAIEYAAATLRLAGIEPFGAEKSYYQRVPVRRVTNSSMSIDIESREGAQTAKRTFVCGVDCIAPAVPPQVFEAPVVFAGYGIRESKAGRDDYAGLDVRGRIVMIVGGVPPGAEWQSPELVAKYAQAGVRQRYAAKLELAKRLGAAAVLAVEDDGFGASIAEAMADEERAFRSYDHEAKHEAPLLVRVSRSVACAVVGEESLLSGHPRRPTQATATIRASGEETLIVSRNVIGVIPGADPKLRDEAVVIGAHIDHLGRSGETIFHGADDNASGVSALLEIAKAFAAGTAPKRTVIIAFWTGEEEGRFGSLHYVRNPRWPLARTVAYLNLDMIGHPWLMSEIKSLVTDAKLPDAETFLEKVQAETFVEAGLPRGNDAIREALRVSAEGNGLPMHYDWTDGKEGGSDYRDFARQGVPFIRFFGNFFPDYHKTGDTFDRLDPRQIERVARFAFATAWQLANP